MIGEIESNRLIFVQVKSTPHTDLFVSNKSGVFSFSHSFFPFFSSQKQKNSSYGDRESASQSVNYLQCHHESNRTRKKEKKTRRNMFVDTLNITFAVIRIFSRQIFRSYSINFCDWVCKLRLILLKYLIGKEENLHLFP